jgi:hypothetical protein
MRLLLDIHIIDHGGAIVKPCRRSSRELPGKHRQPSAIAPLRRPIESGPELCREVKRRPLAESRYHLPPRDHAAAFAAQIPLRSNRRLQTAMRSSRLPAVKTLQELDFSFQPSIKREQIDSLAELGVVERKENGAKVSLHPLSSGSEPFSSINDTCSLEFNPRDFWTICQMDSVAYFCEKAKGRFAVAPSETIAGISAPYGLRGSEMFAALIEDPESCLKALKLLQSVGFWMAKEQEKITGSCQERVFDHWQVWLPGNPIWLSVDMNCLCAADLYETFGFDDSQTFFDHFGGGWIPTSTSRRASMSCTS